MRPSRQVRDLERQLTRCTTEARACMDRVTLCPASLTDPAWVIVQAALGSLRSIAAQQDRLLDLRLDLG